jgi:hypothetical protein
VKKKILGIIAVTVILGTILALAGCSKNSASAQGTSTGGGTYSPTSITPAILADSVTIPVSTVNTDKNVEFNVTFDQGTASYMAYVYNGAIQVRASVCVPCQGRSFTVKGNTLVCNTCGTVFSAQTGKGISGVAACQNYPKASVSFTTGADGSLTMTKADLLTAFTNTLTPGLP